MVVLILGYALQNTYNQGFSIGVRFQIMMCIFWFYAFQAWNCYTIFPLFTETYRFSVDKNKCKYVRSETLFYLKIRN